jgi:hypothetical protein
MLFTFVWMLGAQLQAFCCNSAVVSYEFINALKQPVCDSCWPARASCITELRMVFLSKTSESGFGPK